MRRDQIHNCESRIQQNAKFHADAAVTHRLHAHDLSVLIGQASDAATLRSLINNNEVTEHVRSCMCHVQSVIQSVMATDSERNKIQSNFQALRYYHCPAMLFWTLDPRDSNCPLTIRYMADGLWKHHKVPLDVDELSVHSSLDDIRKQDSHALHDMILDDPVAASICFHTTVRMTLEYFLIPRSQVSKDHLHLFCLWMALLSN